MTTPETADTLSFAAPDSEARRNLLLSFPELDVAHDGRDVIDGLVEGAICHLLAKSGVDKMLILHDVAAAVRDLAGLSYEPAELVSSFERLERRGRLSFRDQSHRSFVYEESAYRATAEAFRLRMGAWDAVRGAWMDEMRQRHDIDAEQASALWEALDAFATSIMDSYAAEAAAFLYLRDAAGQTRFYEALQLRLPDVAETVAPELVGIATEEFPRFFDPSDASRTDYLTGRLRAAFFFHLLSVDPTASALVRAQVSEKVLYLDSNFLFRLIGFHGPSLAFTPIAAVEVSKQLNCRLVVARETVEEFVRVVKANVGHLKSVPITRESYLRVAAEHPSDEGEFMAAYYRELQSGRVRSPEEFGRKWSNVRAFLQQWGIEIDEDAYADDEDRRSDPFIDEMSRLQQWHSGNKNPVAVEHDVAMLRFIRRQRGRIDATSAEVRVWFLTFDRQLTRYSAYYATEEHLPAALLAEDWLQIARPFLPRTDDYAKSFVAMLRHPMLYQGSTKVPFSHMAEALSRLERYQEMPEQVVAAMVADEQFTRSFIGARTEQEARSLIEVKAGTLAANALNQNQSLNEQLAQVRAQVATLTENIDTLRDARDSVSLERDRARHEAAASKDLGDLRVEQVQRDAERSMQQQVAELRREFSEQLNEAVTKARTVAAEDTRREMQPRLAAAVRWTAYWSLCGAITLVGVFSLLLNWSGWTSMQRTVIVVGVVLSWLVLLWIPKGWNAALGLSGSVASLIGVAVWGQTEWSKAARAEGGPPPAAADSVVAPTGGGRGPADSSVAPPGGPEEPGAAGAPPPPGSAR